MYVYMYECMCICMYMYMYVCIEGRGNFGTLFENRSGADKRYGNH